MWRETPFFSPRERGALAWTEVVTDIARSGVSDPLYDEARAQSIDKELVDLSVAVIAINSWNRLAVTPTKLHASLHRRPPDFFSEWRDVFATPFGRANRLSH